jgi:hypothetical protein
VSAPRSCPFEEDVLLLEDNELPFDRRVVVEAHLGACRECAALEEALDRATSTLRALEDAPLGAAARALQHLPPRRARLLPSIAVASAAAAAVLLTVSWPEDVHVPEPRPVTAGIPDAPAIPEARHALEIPAPSRRGPPLVALLERLEPGVDEYQDALREVVEQVRRGGAARRAELARALDSERPEIVRRALDVAERAPSPVLAGGLEALLDDAELGPRAARTLGGLESRSAVPALTVALDGPAGDEARDALARIGSRAAYEALSERARTVPAKRCEPFLDAAVRASPTTGARLLLELAADEETRAGAYRVLQRHREALLSPLRELAGNGDAFLAAAAAAALGEARDADAVPLLADLAKRRVTDRAATVALVRIGTRESVAAALAAADRDGAELAFDGLSSAEAPLLELLDTGTLVERREALRLLGRCGGPATIEALAPGRLPRALATDAMVTLGSIGGDAAAADLAVYARDPAFREAAIDALGATGAEDAVAVLLDVGGRRDERRVARALGRIPHEESARALVQMLGGGAAPGAAADALATLPAEVVVPVLIGALDDDARRRRLRSVLVRIAGVDHGAAADGWRAWWQAHS